MNLYDINGVDEGVVSYMQGREGISGQVGYPVTEIFVPSNDEFSFLNSSAWEIDNLHPPTSKQKVMPGKLTPYQRHSSYLHSFAP